MDGRKDTESGDPLFVKVCSKRQAPANRRAKETLRRIVVHSGSAGSMEVPRCISMWKNKRGYMVPLEARLGANEPGISPNMRKFQELNDALDKAEREARMEPDAPSEPGMQMP